MYLISPCDYFGQCVGTVLSVAWVNRNAISRLHKIMASANNCEGKGKIEKFGSLDACMKPCSVSSHDTSSGSTTEVAPRFERMSLIELAINLTGSPNILPASTSNAPNSEK